MSEAAATRASLLLRIRNPADQQSWSLFVDIYGPLIFRFARKNRLQESDAADLVQDVMEIVHKSIEKFDYDPQLGRFRSWLYRVARNALSKRFRQSHREVTISSEGGEHTLEGLPDEKNELEEFWEREYRETVLQWAMNELKGQFQESTWQAFYLSTIEQLSPEEVAARLGVSVGSIYVSKSRVKKAISTKIQEIDGTE